MHVFGSQRSLIRIALCASAATVAGTALTINCSTEARNGQAIARTATVQLAGSPASKSSKPTVVLVHGAFADASSWNGVTTALLARGYPVIAVANPLRSLSGDAAYVAGVLASISGDVVLVGHSYGGAVITNAASGQPNVKALVYVAAFAPDAGQSVGELGKDYPTPPGIQKLVADAQGWLSLPPQALAQDFAQDVPAAQAAVMAVTQGPIQSKAFGDKPTGAAWKTRPSWYIVSANDCMISPDLERAMAKKIGATTTTLPTSHVPQQSRPADVAAVILAAVKAATK